MRATVLCPRAPPPWPSMTEVGRCPNLPVRVFVTSLVGAPSLVALQPHVRRVFALLTSASHALQSAVCCPDLPTLALRCGARAHVRVGWGLGPWGRASWQVTGIAAGKTVAVRVLAWNHCMRPHRDGQARQHEAPPHHWVARVLGRVHGGSKRSGTQRRATRPPTLEPQPSPLAQR